MRAPSATAAGPLVIYVLTWTLAASIALLGRPLHQDMLEAWAWGQELQLGYFKHPPLSAWIAAGWFSALPRADWSFYLLAMLNSAVGLIGIWMVAGRLTPDPSVRAAAVWLHGLAPFHSLFALNFNPNSVQLSVWPWTIYLLVRTLETRRFGHAVALGLLAGLAMLAKYYGVILLTCCGLAALAHPEARRFFRAPAPWLAATTAALVVTPHALWAYQNDFSTLAYAIEKTQQSWLVEAREAVIAGVSCIALLAGMAAAVWWRRPVAEGERPPERVIRLFEPEWRWLAILVLGPYLLTIAIGLAGLAKVSIVFMTPAFGLVPLALLLATPQHAAAALLARIRSWAIGAQLACLGLAPLAAGVLLKAYLTDENRRSVELAAAVDAVARAETGKLPAIVGGFGRDALIVAFYGAGRPSVLVNLDLAQAPWVSRERIARDGLVVVCGRAYRELCRDRIDALGLGSVRRREIQVRQRVQGFDSVIRRFDVHLMAPAGDRRRGS